MSEMNRNTELLIEQKSLMACVPPPPTSYFLPAYVTWTRTTDSFNHLSLNRFNSAFWCVFSRVAAQETSEITLLEPECDDDPADSLVAHTSAGLCW